MNVRPTQRALALIGAGLLVGALLPGASVSAANPTVTPATGGTGILTTTAANTGSGAWTTLTGPVITEGAIGDFTTGQKIQLSLPPNFQFNAARVTAPSVSSCDKESSAISYANSASTATITLALMAVGQGSLCKVDFGTILQVRPIDGSLSAGSGGTIGLAFIDPALPTPGVYPGGAGQVSMVAPSPSPTPTPTPKPSCPGCWSVTPATGGTGIPYSTAGNGGSGAWTTLTGPTVKSTSTTADLIAPNTKLTLGLPSNFEFNPDIKFTPTVTPSGCGLGVGSITYFGAGNAASNASIDVTGTTGGGCSISFGTKLQVRPVSADPAAGTGGSISVDLGGVTLATGGTLTMTTPPPGTLTLTTYSPTMNNNAIIWGQSYVDLTTTGAAGTKFQIEASTDEKTWTPLKNSSGAVLTFSIASNGSAKYRYTPIRNYWYRSVAGSTKSNTPRVTVRETCSISPSSSSTKTVAAGTSVTFSATVRPARSDLPKANVLFQVYGKSGSTWVLFKSVTKVIDDAGVAQLAWTFTTPGSWYVRAQAQPTSVNSNSFWTPNQYYTVQ